MLPLLWPLSIHSVMLSAGESGLSLIIRGASAECERARIMSILSVLSERRLSTISAPKQSFRYRPALAENPEGRNAPICAVPRTFARTPERTFAAVRMDGKLFHAQRPQCVVRKPPAGTVLRGLVGSREFREPLV
jgi:hypothetical protein